MPACPCDRCWRRESISDIRPASGTRRWLPSLRRAKQDPHHQPREDAADVCGSCAVHQGSDFRRGQGAVRRTKRSAREAIQKEAERAAQPFVNQRWLGGCSRTSRPSANPSSDSGKSPNSPPPVRWTSVARKRPPSCGADGQARRSLGGIKHMDSLPDALFVVDSGTRTSRFTNQEARHSGGGHRRHQLLARWHRLRDPGNDDACAPSSCMPPAFADAVLEGKQSVPQVGSAKTSSSTR